MDEKFMDRAISLAKVAITHDETPIGAVIVKDGEIIAEAYNLKESTNNAIWHAEMVAIDRATKALGNWYLSGCEMYVTLEPCVMCVGAIVNSRIDNVYFGAYDKRFGCCGSMCDLVKEKKFNHTPNIVGGIKEKECGILLTEFFKTKRKKADK